MRYQIDLGTDIDPTWSEWFEGMNAERRADGRTRLTGSIRDQAELHGVIARLRDLGIEIISVIRVDHNHEENIVNPQQQTLVLGATGKTGRRVVGRLRDRGLAVREGSRHSEPRFDWNDETTWAPIVEGMDAVYIAYHPDLAAPGAPETVRAFADTAIERGVRKLVLLSGRGEVEAQRAEQEVLSTSADVTVVRCAWFMQNFSEDFMHGSVMSGQLVLPGGAGREPFVDADDIADVAVAALTEDGHAGEIYELTSPSIYSLDEVAAELSNATGRPIQYVPISVEEYAAGASDNGVPPELVTFLTYLFGEVFGNNAYVTDGVQRALGRPARDLATFARDAAAAGAWTPAPVA